MDFSLTSGRLSPERILVNQISHVIFFDDMLTFCKADKAFVKELNHFLELLLLNTGFTINMDKSKLFLSKGCKHRGALFYYWYSYW